MNQIRVLPFALVLLGTLPSAAQEVLRCEGADGRVTYSGGPCPPGTRAVRTLPPPEAPSATDQQAARQRAQQDLRNATALDRARRSDEERLARDEARVQAKAKKQESECRRLETRLRHAQEDAAAATAGKRTEAQRRVQRAEELFVADCGPITR